MGLTICPREEGLLREGWRPILTYLLMATSRIVCLPIARRIDECTRCSEGLQDAAMRPVAKLLGTLAILLAARRSTLLVHRTVSNNSDFTDNFSDPGRAIGRVYVCLCVGLIAFTVESKVNRTLYSALFRA